MRNGKYNVSSKEKRTWNGKVYDSKIEMVKAREFALLKKTGDILELEEQPVIELLPKPNRVSYKPDFRIVWKNGNEEYIDVKGVETAVFRIKHKMFKHFYPNKKLVIMK